jgi:hypothetical protein
MLLNGRRERVGVYLLAAAAARVINAKALADDTSSMSWIRQSRESFFYSCKVLLHSAAEWGRCCHKRLQQTSRRAKWRF